MPGASCGDLVGGKASIRTIFDRSCPWPYRSVTVTTAFPSDAVKTTTNTVHVWVLTGAGDAGASCGDLVGGKVDPYDPGFDRLGDVVTKDPSTAAALTGVGVGGAFVFVEGQSDTTGRWKYAGCNGARRQATVQHGGRYAGQSGGVRLHQSRDQGRICPATTASSAPSEKPARATSAWAVRPGHAPAVPMLAAPRESCDETKRAARRRPPWTARPATTRSSARPATLALQGNASESRAIARPGSRSVRNLDGQGARSSAADARSSPPRTTEPPCDDGVFCTTNDKCNFSGKW